MFNLITGFLRADGGSIRFKGEELLGMAPHEVEARGVVRTFQHLRLWGKMTVLENVLLGCRTPARARASSSLFLRPARVREEEATARRRALEVLEFFGLAGRAHELAEDLAYPEQKLLSMARIFATDARGAAARRADLRPRHRLARSESCRWCGGSSNTARRCCSSSTTWS